MHEGLFTLHDTPQGGPSKSASVELRDCPISHRNTADTAVAPREPRCATAVSAVLDPLPGQTLNPRPRIPYNSHTSPRRREKQAKADLRAEKSVKFGRNATAPRNSAHVRNRRLRRSARGRPRPR